MHQYFQQGLYSDDTAQYRLNFGTAGTYEGETYIPGQQPNITAQMELQALAPELAAQLQAQAAPAAPAMHPGDAAVMQRFGYSVPTAA